MNEEDDMGTITDETQMTLTGPWGTVAFSPVTAGANAAVPSELATVTITTEESVAEQETSPVAWEGVLVLEGVATDDNTPTPRIMLPEAMTWRDLPLPLMGMTKVTEPGHYGHEVCGRIDEIWREPRPDLGANVFAIMGRGVFDTSEFGQEIARLVADKTLRGISIDPVAVEWALARADTLELVDEAMLTAEDVADGNFYLAYVSASIAAATVCPMQAIAGASIAVLVASAETSHVQTGLGIWIIDAPEFQACAAGPIAPPASWFANPNLKELTPLVVEADGRCYGHVGTWECHVGFADRCMRMRPTTNGYAGFHTGRLVTEEGETLRVGRITVKPHAPSRISRDAVQKHYDDVDRVAAYGRLYEDQFGVQFAGVTRSNASPEVLRDFLANSPSVDQRNGELLGISTVPFGGLPIIAPEAVLVASAEGDVELDMLLLPGVTPEFVASLEEPREATEMDVMLAAAEMLGPEAMAALIAE